MTQGDAAATSMTLPDDRRAHPPDARDAEFALLFPVLDDWESLRTVLARVDDELASAGFAAYVVCVDDGSTQPPPGDLLPASARALRGLEIITLKGNFGHQRAIAIGLSQVATRLDFAAVIVMDADGEDLPSDVPRLIAAFRERSDTVVFAQRTRRSEGMLFSAGYNAYRLLHRVLTGIPVQVGNFCLIPEPLLQRLVVTSDLWNHCAAAIVHARLPAVMVPTRRGQRAAGRSSMNFQSLVRHGFSAMSVFSDRIGVRLLVGMSFAGGALLIAAALATAAGWWAVLPAGAFTIAVAALLLAGLAVLVLLTFLLTVLRARGDSGFVPVRDHTLYVEGVRTTTRVA
jgi:polyisoprenyl-phosphate glycosyltransferase